MFKAELSDPRLLRNSIDAISNMIDEAGISVGKEGMRLRAMDPAHVALVDFELKKEAFDRFEATKPMVLGLDLDRFNTILKRAGVADRIALEAGDEAAALKIRIEGTSKRVFELPLIEVSEEELKVPSLDFPSSMELEPALLSEGIKDAEIISDHVTLKVGADAFIIEARGDLGNVEVRVEKDKALSYECKSPCKSMFSIEYLKDMIKASDVATSVRISLGENIPVRMDFLAAGAKLSFLLAPRVEPE